MPPAVSTAGGIAGRDERHVDGQLLGHPDQEQVDVERPAVDRVDLDAVDEDRARPCRRRPTEVDQGVPAGVPAQLLELVGVDRHVVGAVAMPVDHGRQLAGVAQAADRLAGDVAMRGGQRRSGSGHGMGPQDSGGGGSIGAGLRLAGGAGSARRPGAAVPYHERPADGGTVGRGERRAPGVASPRGRHHPHRRRRARRRPRHPVRPPAGGLRGRRRALRRGGPRDRGRPGARTSWSSTSACPASTASRCCAGSAPRAPRCRSWS